MARVRFLTLGSAASQPQGFEMTKSEGEISWERGIMARNMMDDEVVDKLKGLKFKV